ALAFGDRDVVVAGGPNLPCPDTELVERAVALSPGNPVEVLVGDDRAEHVPGCNLALRRSALNEIGGFDAGYTAAGDDVDVCWRLLDRGGRIAFSPAAQVHHHRRDTVRGYLRQQRGYGRAERMLTGHHRERFNRLGAARWSGFVYGGPRILPRVLKPVIYYGPMGVAPFQTELLDRAAATTMWAGALVPLLVLAGVVALPFALMTPSALVLTAVVLVLLCAYAACVAIATPVSMSEPSPWRLRTLVGVLHLLQPLARMWGRLRGRPLPSREGPERPWTGNREEWLLAIYRDLSAHWCALRRGSPHSSWDIEVRVGPVLRCRLHTAVRWEWDPVARRTWALRRPAAAVLALAVLALLVMPAVGAMVTAALLASACIEAVVLARLSRDAVTHTTRAAQDGE
ncbi:MAG TPA: glycosyltransferase family 2 protein, partial [Actinomycetes bacterium]|nr:glycosyltransferase family 2 protein [Actinomycetes bacterium]